MAHGWEAEESKGERGRMSQAVQRGQGDRGLTSTTSGRGGRCAGDRATARPAGARPRLGAVAPVRRGRRLRGSGWARPAWASYCGHLGPGKPGRFSFSFFLSVFYFLISVLFCAGHFSFFKNVGPSPILLSIIS